MNRIMQLFRRPGTRKLTKGFIAIALVAMIAIASPMTTRASAAGYAFWPGGKLFHAIEGSGTSVKYDGASYQATYPVCDTSIRFTSGGGTASFRSDVRWGCSPYNSWKYDFGGWKAPRGSACAELWSGNWRTKLATQCHAIY